MTEWTVTREDLIAEGWDPCNYCGRPIRPGYEEIHAKTCRRRQEAVGETTQGFQVDVSHLQRRGHD